MTPSRLGFEAIRGFRLVSADPERLAGFYRAIGFAVGETVAIAAEELAVLGIAGAGWRLALSLGPSRIELDRFEPAGQAYPRDATAADLAFQHLALITDDAEAAWARARAAGAMPISRHGAVTLPPAAGGVTAVKFRDPEGHPLEFLRFPPGARAGWPGRGVLGIDHSALSVADADRSRRFYGRHGLTEGDRSLNHGTAQDALDGLDGVAVDVVPMRPPEQTPHVELLAYRRPAGRPSPSLAVNDVAATRIVWRSDAEALVRDPDGHLHQLSR